MTLHDAYLRRTPFELTFPDVAAADDFVAAVATAAEAAGVDPADRRDFVTLDAVGSFLRRIRPEEGERVGPEAAYDYALLLYHEFHFARHGASPLLVSEVTARALVDGSGIGREAPADGRTGATATEGGTTPAALTLPTPAGYAQLPRNLFWIQSSPDEPAEAVDGFFWCLGEAGLMHVLLAAGIRDDRPGLAVVPVAEAPWADAPGWLDAPVRSEGRDFASTLPGGEIDELYSFTTAGEVLKLAARLFAHLGARPDAPPTESPPSPTGAAPSGAAKAGAAPDASPMLDTSTPTPSSLPYRRI